MSTIKVSTIAPLGTDATKTITIGSHSNGDAAAGVFTNGPSFLSFLTSSQSTANDTATTIICNSIIFETTNSGYNTSTGKFTPTVAGKYFLYANLHFTGMADGNDVELEFQKNGTRTNLIRRDSNANEQSIYSSFALDLNGTGDYATVVGKQNSGGSKNVEGISSIQTTYFGAYRIIGA